MKQNREKLYLIEMLFIIIMAFTDSTLIIPTLNEGKNISRLLAQVKAHYPSIRIIVSDDGSTDGTQEIANNTTGCLLLDRSDKPIHGLTISVLNAILQAKTEFCIVMDGDGQHPYEKIGEIIMKLRSGADLVVGTRKTIPNWSLERRIMSYIATFLGRFVLFLRGALQCTDPMSGFFGIRRKQLVMHIEQNCNAFMLEGYKVLFDALKILPKTTRIEEVGYDFGIRGGGDSKIGLEHIKIYFSSLFK